MYAIGSLVCQVSKKTQKIHKRIQSQWVIGGCNGLLHPRRASMTLNCNKGPIVCIISDPEKSVKFISWETFNIPDRRFEKKTP